ncbi:BppU family phage baseplate upper protein [Limosilactobacillus vaginalis]|uniref:BppU family phage baseplate upper protein n=1 Tax=Limosilactobacillus vaginalis TaxID=1633 RepID=UPI0022E80884|nr:BppU family phage baseplate upper protein [Limosilactobacillus vaginalis]
MANDYVVLDLEKPTQTLINLTNNFQGRVGDSRAYCKLWVQSNGIPYDLTKDGRSVGFSGVDPDGDKWVAVGWAAADQPGDNAQVGRITYYFPAGMFRVEGDWDKDSTFFYVDDENTDMHVSTTNVWLHIFANEVEMGISATPYKSDLDKAVDEVKSYAQQKQNEIDNSLQEINSGALMQKVQALSDAIGVYTGLIKQNAVATKDEMQDYIAQLLGSKTTGDDLNLLLDQGSYVITNANTSNNPAKTTGTLIVSGDSGSMSQLFIDTQANLWVRSGGTQGWSDWREQVAWS